MVVVTATQFRTSPGWEEAVAIVVDENLVPADPSIVQLHVRRTARGNELTWTDSTTRARTFYHVYRASPSTTRGVICELNGVDQCELEAEIPRQDARHALPRPVAPAGRHLPDRRRRELARRRWTAGDVFAISPPAAPVRRMSVTSHVRTAVAFVAVYLAFCVFSEGGLITDSLWGDVGHYEDFGRRILDGDVPYGDFTVEYPPFALPVFVAPALVTSSALRATSSRSSS